MRITAPNCTASVWIPSCSVAGMSFGIYLAGILIVIGGLVYGAVILHVPVPWIVVGGLVCLGSGMLVAVKATRQKDPATPGR